MTIRYRPKLYRYAAEWIALNDETAITDRDEIAALVTVALVADMFGFEADDVARDVLRYRRRAFR